MAQHDRGLIDLKNITGQRFGRLVAISLAEKASTRKYWKCLCDCGSSVVVRQDQLIAGKTKSCGCLSSEVRRQQMAIINSKKPPKKPRPDHDLRHDRWSLVKHDNPRLYRIWQSMKSRCYYEKNRCFSSYGGRGIKICDDWKTSFASFAGWALLNGYCDNLSIDRIDVDGDYSPDNCRWITMKDQQKNKRKRSTPHKHEAFRNPECSSTEIPQDYSDAHLISRQQYITALRRSSSGGNLYEQ